VVCQVGRQLADTFAISARQYAEAAASLGSWGVVEFDYVRLFRGAEEALGQAEAARAALRDHLHRHRCAGGVRAAAAGD
jgi:hypothetical protein